MMSITKKKCKRCNGEGLILIQHQNLEPTNMECPECEGLGVPLNTVVEDQYEEYAQASGDYINTDDERYIDFEEDDYEY